MFQKKQFSYTSLQIILDDFFNKGRSGLNWWIEVDFNKG